MGGPGSTSGCARESRRRCAVRADHDHVLYLLTRTRVRAYGARSLRPKVPRCAPRRFPAATHCVRLPRALASVSPLVHAQAVYPNRPIRLVVPYPPGALTDLLARTIAERMAAGLGQPMIIENKPGAGTLVGAELVAKAAPDGYTLLMATSTTLGISPALYQPSPVNPVRDFAPIGQVGSVNFFLIANPAFPARTVREMIDAIKSSPGKYNYASVGSGSPHHLFMETLKTRVRPCDPARSLQGYGRRDHRRAHERRSS